MPHLVRSLFAGGGLAATLALAAQAQVASSLQIREYPVPGTTPRTLVGYMLANPLQGAHGTAVANIRADQSLRVSTRPEGGRCRATAVRVQIHFTMTLPRAVHAQAMTANARSAWAGFAAFARRHEDKHRAITMQCARRFEAQTRGVAVEGGCETLEAALTRLFETASTACGQIHAAFDQAESARLRALPLMRAAQ